MDESKKDKKGVEAKFLKNYGFIKRHYYVHHVWCLNDDPVKFPA